MKRVPNSLLQASPLRWKMASRAGAILLVLAGAALVATTARGHPGGLDEKGCHVCRTKCAGHGLEAGERHCHGEARADQPRETSFASAWVTKVLDGDTLKVRSGGKKMTIRVLGIDCPESKRNRKCVGDKKGCAWQIPWGMKAARRAAELLKRKVVTLECPGKCTEGNYGRPLRYVRLPDGRDFGEVMIEEGLCADYGWKYPHRRGPAYRRTQAPVQAAGRGMWREERW